ncbi:MAG: SLBB domain-containing protein, partial [Gemmatimonadota bacterium]|nr:SLBB domain-containing protein [Gemmatimonadota bacterium]MDQ8152538.1 SLBB domain-containing protein [Gemmatimonadota bacterium]
VLSDSVPLVFTVDESGHVTIPLAGAVRVSGLTPIAAARAVQERYAAVSRVADVSFIPLRRVVVSGAVNRQEVLFVENGTTVGESIVLAGGVSWNGNDRRVELWRDGTRRAVLDMRSVSARATLVSSSDEILVRRASWLTRNANVLLTVATSLVSVAVILITAQ